VIGAGAWGTALAQVAGWAGLDTLLQAREPEVVESIRERRVNEAFLPGVVLDDHVSSPPNWPIWASCDVILAVPPAQHHALDP
jgi:glycerol-3-phosphate dehydrogenase (NAD(P)+)